MNIPGNENYLYVRVSDHEIPKFEQAPDECKKIIISDEGIAQGRIFAYLQKKEGVTMSLDDAIGRIKNFLSTEEGIPEELHKKNGVDLIIFPDIKPMTELSETVEKAKSITAPHFSESFDSSSYSDGDDLTQSVSPPDSPSHRLRSPIKPEMDKFYEFVINNGKFDSLLNVDEALIKEAFEKLSDKEKALFNGLGTEKLLSESESKLLRKINDDVTVRYWQESVENSKGEYQQQKRMYLEKVGSEIHRIEHETGKSLDIEEIDDIYAKVAKDLKLSKEFMKKLAQKDL